MSRANTNQQQPHHTNKDSEDRSAPKLWLMLSASSGHCWTVTQYEPITNMQAPDSELNSK
eukprot:361871-Pyramimonas_sp.AAC.1